MVVDANEGEVVDARIQLTVFLRDEVLHPEFLDDVLVREGAALEHVVAAEAASQFQQERRREHVRVIGPR